MADPIIGTPLYWQWWLNALKNIGMGSITGDPTKLPPANLNRAIRPVSQLDPGITLNSLPPWMRGGLPQG